MYVEIGMYLCRIAESIYELNRQHTEIPQFILTCKNIYADNVLIIIITI